MRYVLIILGVVVGLIVLAFVLLVINSILGSRRQRQRARAKLAAVLDPMAAGREPDPVVVRDLAAQPETRNALYEALAEVNRQHLFPPEFRTRKAFAEADLAYWLAHPNELRNAPDEMELAQVVTLPAEDTTVEYYLFRFRTRPPHWAAKKGWMVGVSGPYLKDPDAPLADPSGTFSELEPFDARTPEEHVRAFHERAVGHGALDSLREQLKKKG